MIEVRAATSADLPVLPEIERSAGEAFLETQHAWVSGDVVTEVEEYLPRLATGDLQVALADGALAGLVNTEVLAGELHIWELAVSLDHQRRGIGRRLMDAVHALARSRGCKAVTLTTFESVSFNAPFYASLGYEILAEPPRHLADILAAEVERGLTDRCAMRIWL
jgi:ribosomal protein S18 acetylase RimI-like enzyme